MAPHLYIYGLTSYRDESTIARFLDRYVDRDASERRYDQGLAMEPIDTVPGAQSHLREQWEWAPTIVEAVRHGLAAPGRAFFVWLTARDAAFDGINLAFTGDDQLSFGVCIDDAGEGPDLDVQARTVLSELVERFPCHIGVAAFGQLPPRDEAAFRALADDPLTMLFFSRDREVTQ